MARPNILFIHVDQMHWEAMSGCGNKYVKTPNMDRMAADGCSFGRAYSSMPQCCPARASWYTGRASSEHGVPTNGCKLLPDIPDLGQWLRKHGNYECVYAGKWHIPGRDVAKSFRFIHGSGKGEFADGGIARACMGFLANYKGNKPFFLNAGFMNPHDCCYTAGAAGGLGKFKLAKDIEEKLPPLPKNWLPATKTRVAHWSKLDWRFYIYTYYRWVEMVDAEIGRLYGAVRTSRFADETVIIFTADHGDGVGFHGNITKGYMEEESWHVPTILVWPGRIQKGHTDDKTLSIGVDIPATICDYAQVPGLPKMTVGKSLRQVAEGKSKGPLHKYVVGESFLGKGQVGVRDGQHKSIFYCDGVTKVFDLKADPLEMKDLAAEPAGKNVAKVHMGYLREYLGKVELCKKVPAGKAAYQTYLNYYAKVEKGG